MVIFKRMAKQCTNVPWLAGLLLHFQGVLREHVRNSGNDGIEVKGLKLIRGRIKCTHGALETVIRYHGIETW